jgi:capsular polysaccharide biosynthesis protein
MSALSEMTVPGSPNILTSAFDGDVAEESAGPLIDLSVLMEGVRRRRRFWLTAALLGLLVGAGFHLVVAPKYAATVDLYMVEPAGVDPTQAIANDVSLLQTRVVAGRAVSALHLHMTIDNFLATYHGEAVSNVILSIKLSAPSSARAVTYDDAVAVAFLAVRGRELSAQTNVVVDDLNDEVGALNGDIKNLTNEINVLSNGKAGPGTATQIAALVNQRTGDASQVSQIQSEVQQDQLVEVSAVKGSEILDPASPAKVSVKKVFAMDGLSGVVAGLALGLGTVAVGEAVSDRPRRRADVAAALGVPVELSLGRLRRRRWAPKSSLRRRVKKPKAALRVLVKRMRGHLDSVPASALAVVAVEAGPDAALGVAALALSLAAEDKRVVIADMAPGRPLARLLKVRGKPGSLQAVRFAGRPMSVFVAPEDPTGPPPDGFADADAVVVLAEVSPTLGADHLADWASAAVIVVTAGGASASRMSSVSQLMRQAGIKVISAVLLGGAPDDESLGSPSAGLPVPKLHSRGARGRTGDDSGGGPRIGDRRRENGTRLPAAVPAEVNQP